MIRGLPTIEDQRDYWERGSLQTRRPPHHPVVAEYVERTLRYLVGRLPLSPELRLLDAGCGDGRFTVHLGRRCWTVGVDFSKKLLSQNPEQRLAQMDVLHLGFTDNAFDVVFCGALLHHIDDIDAVIREFRRVSRRYLVLVEPNGMNPLMLLFSMFVPEERGTLRFSPAFLRTRVKQRGFRILISHCYGLDMPNRWPTFLLPIVRMLGFRHPLGTSHLLVAEKVA